MLTWEKAWNLVKTPQSILNQEVELNYQVEVQDHIHAQVQFQEKDNLPKCQWDFQHLKFGQVQMGVLKLNLGFQNDKSPGSNQWSWDIWIGQWLMRENFLIPINIDQLTQLCFQPIDDWAEDFWNYIADSCKISTLFSRCDVSLSGCSRMGV